MAGKSRLTKNKKPNLPKSVTLHLTESCNLRCKMCYFWGITGCYSNKKIDRSPKNLELDIIKNLTRDLAPVKPMYSLFGGEPFLHPQIEDVIRTIKEAGSVVDTPTNGTLLTEKSDMLIRTGFDNVRVSLDGPREINDSQRGNGSYNKAMNGIDTLYRKKQEVGAKKPLIGIIFTVTQENFLSIEQFLDHIGKICGSSRCSRSFQ